MANNSKKSLYYIFVILILFFFITLQSFGQTIDVTIPDTTGAEGSTISIPVRCNSVTGLGVYAYGFKLTYDQNIITATGVTVEETISSPWGAPTFNVEEEAINIAAASSTPLEGEGVLVFINFSIIGAVGSNTLIQFTEAVFNEGEPLANTSDGKLTVVESSTVKPDLSLPNSFKISPAYPNPFNPSTAIDFELPQRSRITVKVYDELGRFVNKLVDETMDIGHHSIIWSGHDQSHREVSSGIYFINISTGNTTFSVKVVKLN